MKYRAEIDGLRAVAIMPVIFFHAGFTLFSGGYVGVDIFFVISGYLITSIVLSDLRAKTFSFGAFYERRARRIFPALFVVLLSTLPFAWLWLLPEDLKSFSKSLYFVASFCSNILFWKTSGYFDGDAELKPLLHTWSLGVEEQYYMLFPVVMWLLWRFQKRLITWVIGSLMLMSLFAADSKISISPMSAFYFLPYRAWELLIGALIASYELSKKETRPIWQNQICSALGAALVVFSIFFLDKKTPYPSHFTLTPVIGAALLIMFAKPRTLVHRALANRALAAIGLVSYSAYLWHQPIFALTKHRLGSDLEFPILGALVTLVFVLSYFSWKYVEHPCRDRARFGKRSVVVASLTGLVFFGGIGALGDMKDGFPNRFNYKEKYAGDIGQEPYYEYAEKRFFVCTPDHLAQQALTWGSTKRCMQSKKDAPIDVILLGDSHAEHLFIGLSESFSKSNFAFYIKASPSLIRNDEYQEIFQEIARNRSAHTVVLSMFWVGKIHSLPNDQSFERELIDTVKFLLDQDKKVVVIDDVPRFPFPAERCKYSAHETGRSTCEISKWSVMRYELLYKDILERLTQDFPQVRYIPLRDYFCSDESCSMTQDGVVLYRDNHHLNILGSQYVGAKLFELLPEFKH